MKKTHYQKLLIIILTLIISGCTKNPNDAANYNAKIINNSEFKYAKTINFMGHWKGQGSRENIIHDAIRSYEFQNQDTRINLVFPEAIFTDLTTAHYEANYIINTVLDPTPAWDIIRVDGKYNEISQILEDPNWAKDNLVDFSQIPEFVNNTNAEILTEEFKANLGGIIPGPILEGQFWCLYYNKVVADKIGIEIKNTKMTFDDFLSYIKAANEYNKQHTDDYIIPVSDAIDWSTAGVLATQLYASLFDTKEEYISTQYSEEKVKKWFQVLRKLEELAAYDFFDKKEQKVQWLDMSKKMLNNEYLFFINGSWMYNIWVDVDSAATKNCYPVELPAVNSSKIYPLGYNVTWGVPKNAPNKEAAIEFLLYMNSADIAQQWVNKTKSPTGIKGRMTDVNLSSDQFENFTNYINNSYSKSSFNTRSDRADIYGIDNLYIPAYDIEVIKGILSADEAIAKIKEHLAMEE